MKAELIDYMGDDLTVVNAARVSFNKESEWYIENIPFGLAVSKDDPQWLNQIAVKSLSEKDQKLIRYLASHGHWTPFSHVQIQMREKVPLFVARQRFKHMVGFTYNERSGRYVGRDVDFFTPVSWRKQAEDKKQGSSDETVSMPLTVQTLYEHILHECEETYNAMIAVGVSIEQARMVLPQSMYTEYYVTGSLAAWARAYKLRIAPDAQKEIQELAKQWDEIIRSIPEMKHSWEALVGS